MAAQDVSENRRPSAVDRSGDRGGSISMVLAVALLLVGSVIALLFIAGSASLVAFFLVFSSFREQRGNQPGATPASGVRAPG